MQAKNQIKDEDYFPLPGRDGTASFASRKLVKPAGADNANRQKDHKPQPVKESAEHESKVSEEVLIARALADLEKNKQS